MIAAMLRLAGTFFLCGAALLCCDQGTGASEATDSVVSDSPVDAATSDDRDTGTTADTDLVVDYGFYFPEAGGDLALPDAPEPMDEVTASDDLVASQDFRPVDVQGLGPCEKLLIDLADHWYHVDTERVVVINAEDDWEIMHPFSFVEPIRPLA